RSTLLPSTTLFRSVLLLLVVAVFEEVVGQLRRVGVAAGFVVDEGAVVAGPVDADAAPDTAVVPDDRAFGDSAAGFKEFGGFRVGAEGVRHGVDLVEDALHQWDVPGGPDPLDAFLDLVGVPAVAVYEDEFGSVAEDDLVGGGAEVELLLGRLRVVEPVLEGGGAFGGELAGACGGEASSGDGVAVVDLGRDVVVDAGLDFGR